MAFDVVDQDITQLFKNDDTFHIPRYQRNYVWKELNWSQLIKDIRYCAEVTPDWSHFIGSMVFERKKKSGGVVDIIDGQQRIITLQIVIFAMIYCYRNIKKKTEDIDIIKRCNVNISYLQDLIINRTLGMAESIKVENGYPEFAELNQILMELKEEELEKYDDIFRDKKRNKSVILQAFKFFVSDFIELDHADLVLLTSQFLKTRVVVISSMQEEEVYNIFEILNARGVKLQQTELLKNYLFKYLKPKLLVDTYKNKWTDLERLLEGIDLDDYYLHVFRCWYYKNKLSKEQLFEVTKEKLRLGNERDFNDFFDFFIKCGKYYRAINDAQENLLESEVYEYFKLKRNKQVRSVLLALKIKNNESILTQEKYEALLILLRNFYVTFNLDNGSSNKIDNDVYVLANEIYKASEENKIEFEVLKFLIKFSTYFEKSNVLEDGLRKIVYSNKSTRKNISSKLLVYFFKPLLLECEENKYIQYDFSKFNVEHVLNDHSSEDIRYSLGNLLLCPDALNNGMRDLIYSQKREKLLASGIPYLVRFGTQFEEFNEKNIETRTIEIVQKLRDLYLISKEDLDQRFSKLQIYFKLKEQLVIAFGKESTYVKELQRRGTEKFIQYVYKNGSLPYDEVDVIKDIEKNILKNVS